MKKSLLLSMMVVLLSLIGCREEVEFLNPSVTVAPLATGETSLTFTITPQDATVCNYVYVEANRPVPEVDAILQNGVSVDAKAESTQTISDLKPSTRYFIVAAVEANGIKVASRAVSMTTGQPVVPAEEPTVAITKQEVGMNYFTFKVEPKNAVKCSYVVVKKGESVPSAEAIIKDGERILPDVLSIQKARGLNASTEYVVAAAVMTGDLYKTAEMTVTTSEAAPIENIEFFVEEATGQKAVDQNFYVRLKNSEHTIGLDFYTAESEILPAGTYKLSSERKENVILTTTSMFGDDARYTTFKEGEVTVAVDEMTEIYDITFKLIQEDGAIVSGSYNGQIEGMFVEMPKYERIEDLEITKINAKHFKNESMLTLTLGKNKYAVKLDFYFPKQQDAKIIPFGNYKVADKVSGDGTQFLSKISNITNNQPNAQVKEDQFTIGEGLVNVDIEDGDWIITVQGLKTMGGTEYNKVFKGQIEGLDAPTDREYVEQEAHLVDFYMPGSTIPGTKIYSLSFYDYGYTYTAQFYITTSDKAEYLTPGIYAFEKEGGVYTFDCFMFYNWNPYAEIIPQEGSVLKVALDQATRKYKITLQILDQEGNWRRLQYDNIIPNMIQPNLSDLEITKAEVFYHYNNNAKILFYFEGEQYRLDLDMNCPYTETTDLPRGTYAVKSVPWGEDNAYTINPWGSKLNDLTAGTDQSLKVDYGEVTVAVDDTQWIITMDGLQSEYGVKINKEFKGQIEGLNLPGKEAAVIEYSSFIFKSFEKVTLPEVGYTLNFEGQNSAANAANILTYTFKCADKHLLPGTYSLKDGSLMTPTTVGPIFPVWDPFTPAEAEAEVALDGEVYTITMSWFDLAGNTIYKGTWTGEIEGMFGAKLDWEISDIDFISLQRTTDPKGFTLNFESYSQGFGITYTVASEDKYLQAGHYSLSEGTLVNPTFIEDLLSPWGGQSIPADATLDVELDEASQIYTILMTWDDGAGHLTGGTWTGKIDGMFADEGGAEWAFERAKAKHFGNEVMLTLYTTSAHDEDFKLDLYFPSNGDKMAIPMAEYPIAKSAENSEYYTWYYSNLKNKLTGAEDYFTPLKGSVIISSEGGDWVVTLKDVETESGNVVNATYKGQIEKLDAPKN